VTHQSFPPIERSASVPVVPEEKKAGDVLGHRASVRIGRLSESSWRETREKPAGRHQDVVPRPPLIRYIEELLDLNRTSSTFASKP
jgi:hypothetical protein